MKGKINFMKSLDVEFHIRKSYDGTCNSHNREGSSAAVPKWNFPEYAQRYKYTSEFLRCEIRSRATTLFIQVSKYYLTCETPTESTNKPRQTKNRCCSPEMTVAFLYLLDLKPLIIILPLCLVTAPRPTCSPPLQRTLSLSRSPSLLQLTTEF